MPRIVVRIGAKQLWTHGYRICELPFLDMSESTDAIAFSKIQAGATMYLEVLRDRPNKTEEFIGILQSRLGWSPSEVVALQTRVADILLEARQSVTPEELQELLLAAGKELECKASVS